MALSDQDILDFVGENPGAGRDAIRKGVARDVSETTIWRLLKRRFCPAIPAPRG